MFLKFNKSKPKESVQKPQRQFNIPKKTYKFSYLNFYVKLFTFFLFHFSLFTSHLTAQVQQEWIKLYPDNDPSFTASANASVLDSLGNIYVTGSAGSSTFSAYCTVKYSPLGVLQWSHLYLGSNYGGRQANDIAIDKFGNLFVTGRDNNPGNNFNYLTVKYDFNGNLQWVKSYDGPRHGYDEAQVIASDNAGNIYVLGLAAQSSGGESYALVKYSNDGRELWVRYYSITTSVIYRQDMKVDDSCNIYITSDYGIAVTAKYDSSGNRLWLARFPGYGETGSNSLDIDSLHNVYIAGYTKRGIIGTHLFVLKYNVSGSQEWLKTYNTDTNSEYSYYTAQTVVTNRIGNIYVNGTYTPNYNLVQSKLILLKYTYYGNLIWIQKDSTEISTGRPVMATIDNNLFMACASAVPPYNHAIILIKYDSTGKQLWNTKYYVNGTSIPADLKLDKDFNIYITGPSNLSICTIKYAQIPMGIIGLNGNFADKFIFFQNYPNPFNLKTKIRFQVPLSPPEGGKQMVSLKIYDILGREVVTLFSSPWRSIGGVTYEVEFDGSDLASGIYFYKLLTEEYSETKSMILIK
jgi:hypothetical protein